MHAVIVFLRIRFLPSPVALILIWASLMLLMSLLLNIRLLVSRMLVTGLVA